MLASFVDAGSGRVVDCNIVVACLTLILDCFVILMPNIDAGDSKNARFRLAGKIIRRWQRMTVVQERSPGRMLVAEIMTLGFVTRSNGTDRMCMSCFVDEGVCSQNVRLTG